MESNKVGQAKITYQDIVYLISLLLKTSSHLLHLELLVPHSDMICHLLIALVSYHPIKY
jgi:hypothetical protein